MSANPVMPPLPRRPEGLESTLLEVISDDQLRSPEPKLCSCGLVACSRWGWGSEGFDAEYTCLDCQET